MAYRASQPYLSVKDFGAKGDGSTNDTAAIQAAITAAHDGDAIFFPNGSYRISSQLTWSGKKISLIGTGKSRIVEATAITGTGTAGAMIYATAASDSSIEGLVCQGAETYSGFVGASTKEYCFARFESSDGIRIENVKVTNKSLGLVFDACTNSRIDRFVFIGMLSAAATGSGAGTDAYSMAVKMYGGSRNVVTDLNASNAGSAINLSPAGSVLADRLVVSNAAVDTMWDKGIVVNGADTATIIHSSFKTITGTAIDVRGSRLIVTGNQITTATIGIAISGHSLEGADSFTSKGHGSIITDNRLQSISHDGIRVEAVSTNDCRNVRVSGNYIRSCGTATGAYAGILVMGYFHQITGNMIEDSQGTYGIFLSGTSTDLVEGVDLSDNMIVGAAADGFRITYATKCKIANNLFRNITDNAIDMRNTTANEIAANKIEGSVTGTFITANSGNGNSSNSFYFNDGTVDATETNYLPSGGVGTDANTVTGLAPATAATSSTLAARDSSGRLKAAQSTGLGTSAAAGFVPVLDAGGMLPTSIYVSGGGGGGGGVAMSTPVIIGTGNGSTTTFTLPNNGATEMVWKGGLIQIPTTDYTRSGTTITFVTAPASGEEVIASAESSTATTGTAGGSMSTPALLGTGDGSTTTYALGGTGAREIVWKGGAIQLPTTDYSRSGSNITFVTAPALGEEVIGSVEVSTLSTTDAATLNGAASASVSAGATRVVKTLSSGLIDLSFLPASVGGGSMSNPILCTPNAGDGTNTVFTLPGNGQYEQVWKGGAIQLGGGVDYTRSGSTITFVAPPGNGVKIIASTSISSLTGTNGDLASYLSW